MRLFLVAGKVSAGKDTIAKFIKEFYDEKGKKTIITAYAKYIKMFAREITGWDGKEETKPRALLQKIGSEIRDEIREDFFTHRMYEDLEFYKMFYDNVVISDVRLPFEIEYMREMVEDTISIRVERPGYEGNMTEEEASHITEHALENYDRFDFEIENVNLDTLKREVYSILEGLD